MSDERLEVKDKVTLMAFTMVGDSFSLSRDLLRANSLSAAFNHAISKHY